MKRRSDYPYIPWKADKASFFFGAACCSLFYALIIAVSVGVGWLMS